MTNFYFFVSRREDGRMKIYPLPGQHTISSESGQSRIIVPVDVQRRGQAPNNVRNIYVNQPEGTVYYTKCDGSTPFKARLAVLAERDESVYRVENLRKVDELDENNDDDEFILSLYRNLVRLPDESQTDNADNTVTVETSPAPRPVSLGVNANAAASVTKMKAILKHISTSGFNKTTAQQKTLLISELNDSLRNGVAKFFFRKQNGDNRTAWGTLRADVISLLGGESVPPRMGEDRAEDGTRMYYFDVQKKGWRCFCTVDYKSEDTQAGFIVTDANDESVKNRIIEVSSSPFSS